MRNLEFKAKKGGGLAIVAVKQEIGKGQATDIREFDPLGIEVANKVALQGDKASRGGIAAEGVGVTEASLPEAVLKDKINAVALGTSAKGKGTCKEKLAQAKGGDGVAEPVSIRDDDGRPKSQVCPECSSTRVWKVRASDE